MKKIRCTICCCIMYSDSDLDICNCCLDDMSDGNYDVEVTLELYDILKDREVDK